MQKMENPITGRSHDEHSSPSEISYRVLVATGAFAILVLLIVGAFISKQHVEVSMDGFTKIQLKIFEKSRELALQSDSSRTEASPISADIPPDLRGRIEKRRTKLLGAAVLWVDDQGPRQNAWERRSLSTLGVSIDTATTTEEALDLLQSGLAYDVIITDLKRENGDPPAACYPGSINFVTAGCRFIQMAYQTCGDQLAPIIIYAANIDKSAGLPGHTMGATNRFDELTELVLDAVERRPDPKTATAFGGAPCARSPAS
jgi:CheY-like chemotaxis protein